MHVCPQFLHEKSSYCVTQVAEMLIFTELINSASFWATLFQFSTQRKKLHTKCFNNGMPTLFSTHTEGRNNKLVLENAQRLAICVLVLVRGEY